jgi:hypothetical protein
MLDRSVAGKESTLWEPSGAFVFKDSLLPFRSVPRSSQDLDLGRGKAIRRLLSWLPAFRHGKTGKDSSEHSHS